VARTARIIIPDIPHHVTQRGNRRQEVFFSDSDKALYLNILLRNARKFALTILAYCLMNNHVHLVVLAALKEAFVKAIGETHRKYTTIVNIRENWTGYLWQGRFISCPMDAPHLYSAVRYAERNPVRARIVENAEDYPWSSARAHVFGTSDPLLSDIKPYLSIPDWKEYLRLPEEENEIEEIRRHSRTGWPLGSDEFIKKLEEQTGRRLRPLEPGRRRSQKEEQSGTGYRVPDLG
jgi:putative transposase